MKLRETFLSLCLLLVAAGGSAKIGTQPEADQFLRVDVEGKGSFKIQLATERAPKATAQLIRLARQGFYDGQRWFRVVTKPRPFLIQTGDPNSRDLSKIDSPTMGSKGTGARIPFEQSGIEATEGTVFLAAKPGDKDSGDCQFFVLLDTYKFLEGDHTAVGKVVEGIEVVRKIAKGDLINSVRVLSRENLATR